MSLIATDEGIVIAGPIDFTTVMDLLASSLPVFATKDTLVVDLSRVTTVNSAAMALFIEWER